MSFKTIFSIRLARQQGPARVTSSRVLQSSSCLEQYNIYSYEISSISNGVIAIWHYYIYIYIDSIGKSKKDFICHQIALVLIFQGQTSQYSINGLFLGHVVAINFNIEQVASVGFKENFKMYMLKSALQKQYPQVSNRIPIQLYLFSVIVSFKKKNHSFLLDK